MADRVETFAVSCTGGLVTNQPTLAQAAQMPGTARELVNFEPSVEGGYRRINGYSKWSSTPVSALPIVWTTQTYSIGATSIDVAGWYYLADFNGAGTQTFTVSGSATVYTVSSITGDPSSVDDVHATLAFSPALDINLTARHFVFLAQNNFSLFSLSLITIGQNVYTINEYGNIQRNLNNVIYLSLGNHVSGSSLYSRVDGAGQTGTTLTIKNLKQRPHRADSFWIGTSVGSFPSLFVVDSVSSYSASAGTATLTIYPALPTSPSNEALIVWVRRSREMSSGFVYRPAKYAKGSTDYIAFPASDNYPLIFTSAYEPVTQLYDILQADNDSIFCAAYYKNHLFWGSAAKLYISAPFDEFDYTAASGAGVITIPGEITGIIALRNSLIIFCRYNIFRLTGSSIDNFSVEAVTEKTGCVDGNSIQEINGDVMFLSDTGLSRLSDADQQSGLGISVVSNTIKTEINALLAASVSGDNLYPSVFLPSKGQYRVFKYNLGTAVANTTAITGSQVGMNPAEISWSSLLGIKPIVVDYWQEENKAVFVNDNGLGATTYIYEMDSGNTFDGTNITATYSTPYYHMNDPRVRKAFLNLETTVEPEGAVTLTVDTLLNYNKSDVIQPPAVVVGTTGTTYGDNTSPSYVTTLIGNGDVVSLKFTSNTNIPPYVIQSFTIEYSTNDRR
jgi:hypothetical protein